eukprot:1269399-Pyramimonas_sp.AAC.2
MRGSLTGFPTPLRTVASSFEFKGPPVLSARSRNAPGTHRTVRSIPTKPSDDGEGASGLILGAGPDGDDATRLSA